MNRSLLIALVSLLFYAVPLTAADLTQIDRKITREPTYRSKPKYCLLVFGPEAKVRVWLVLDGDTLYVDRNGNGDLTEAGERVTGGKGDGTTVAVCRKSSDATNVRWEPCAPEPNAKRVLRTGTVP